MEITEHIDRVAAEGTLLAAAARRAGLDAAITPCPGWDMRELLRHLAEIHLWAAAQVSNRATAMWPEGLGDIETWWPELANFWPADEELVDYYLETNANLVRELRDAPADLECRTFLDAPSPLAMWARRQAHETAIHRFDAETASSRTNPFAPEFAADGIDELLMAFAPRGSSFPVESGHTMSVRTIDTKDHWLVTMTPDGITSARTTGDADVVLEGTASDLYLAVWNRGDDSGVRFGGDRSAFAAWREGHRIRWS